MTAWAVPHSCQWQHAQGTLPVCSGGCHSHCWRTTAGYCVSLSPQHLAVHTIPAHRFHLLPESRRHCSLRTKTIIEQMSRYLSGGLRLRALIRSSRNGLCPLGANQCLFPFDRETKPEQTKAAAQVPMQHVCISPVWHPYNLLLASRELAAYKGPPASRFLSAAHCKDPRAKQALSQSCTLHVV